VKVRHNVRAVLVDDEHLIFLGRGWPGGSVCCTPVGGGAEPDDADFDAALRREVMEEIGATIGPAVGFLTLTDPGDTVSVVQHYYRADVIDLDPSRRSGPEFDDPAIGDFSLVRIPLDASALAALDLQPPELAAYLREQANTRGA
jgi:8-oxo-dGTP pyrophosphatase MutT (NUDIX family)